MEDERRRERVGMAAAAASAVLFGTSYVATAFALRSFSPVGVGLWRGALAAALLALILVLSRGRLGALPRDRVRLGRLLVLGVVGGPAFIVAMNLAVALAGAAIASFVAGLYAVLAAVLAPLVLRERLPPQATIGFVVALVGTLLLAGLAPSGSVVAGTAAGLAAALAYALYLVLSRRWTRDDGLSGPAISLATLVCSAVVLLGVELVREPAAIVPARIRPDAALGLLWLVVMVSLIAQLLVVASVRRIAARRSSAFLLLNPPSATLVAWLLLGEALGPVELVGGALVLLGIAVASGLLGPSSTGAAAGPDG
ncbi:MAG TPA: DMT family transporter [Candidatus Limnocylindrales bacterium]